MIKTRISTLTYQMIFSQTRQIAVRQECACAVRFTVARGVIKVSGLSRLCVAQKAGHLSAIVQVRDALKIIFGAPSRSRLGTEADPLPRFPHRVLM
jgi:hypothetical protein